MSRNETKSVTTADRVARHTAPHVNARIEEDMEMRLIYFAEHVEDIDRRLKELDREQNIETVLQANAATLSMVGLALGLTRHKRWLGLPLVVSGFLFQHARQGWCPPLSVFRRMGVRTAEEINQERYALKYLRGDFDRKLGNGSIKTRVRKVLDIVNRS
jgi:hypothetical protein